MDQALSKPADLELELYFLIAKYLSRGPCQNAFKILLSEMAKNKLLPKRVDWNGNEHLRNYRELEAINRHIKPDHLLQICQTILPLVGQQLNSNLKGLKSLLGAGQFSILNSEQKSKHTTWKNVAYSTMRNGCPLKPPHNLLHGPPLPVLLSSRETMGCIRMDLLMSSHMYNQMTLQFRLLGHLSSVYCVLFDRTGHYIFTGSDDHLVKVWSAISGRLLCTFRGHAAEINDMVVSYDNQLLAVGSCDKLIRIWSLKNSAPVAILHGHTHVVTALKFSPYMKGSNQYLASTGGDGCLCIWEYCTTTNVFNLKPIKFVERSRAGAQMLCLSFSPGGVFLATGSSDHVVRVYSISGRVPEKICELESHNDRIDSVQYSNTDTRFVTGSKDGFARIWRYERQEWKAIVLNMAATVTSYDPSNNNRGGNDSFDSNASSSGSSHKCVSMVTWSLDDAFVVTSVSDYSIKVWNSFTGHLVHTLKGHIKEVFVLEPNPVDRRVMLSAGHDGYIHFWDLITGTKLRTFVNTIEGQDYGSVYDCKWSPDGQNVVATDSHGYLSYYGYGSGDKYKVLPEEMYFHTDYRPLMRDANNYVIDEQTQMAPHLLPPPFLVDIDGNPHPAKYQRLVPGRETCNDMQLVPLVVVAPNGNREVIDDINGDLRGEPVADGLALLGGGGGVENQAANENAAERPIIDEMIARMQNQQDNQRIAEGEGSSGSGSRGESGRQPSSSSSSNQTAARSSSAANQVEDENSNPSRLQSRQPPPAAQDDEPANQNYQPVNMCIWSQRDLVKQIDSATLKTFFESKQVQADEEKLKYVGEKKKKSLQAIIQHYEDSNDSTSFAKTRTMKQKRAKMLSMGRNEEKGRNRLEKRALYDTDETDREESVFDDEEDEMPLDVVDDDDDDDVRAGPSYSGPVRSGRSGGTSGTGGSSGRQWTYKELPSFSSSKGQGSESESTEYSDWSPDGRTFQPPTTSSQSGKTTRVSNRNAAAKNKWKKFFGNSDEESHNNENKTKSGKSGKGKSKAKRKNISISDDDDEDTEVESEKPKVNGEIQNDVTVTKNKTASKNKSTKRARKKFLSFDSDDGTAAVAADDNDVGNDDGDDTDEDDDDDDADREVDVNNGVRSSERRKARSASSTEQPVLNHLTNEIIELPPEFRPPDWLTSSVPHKSPYFPQMGDEVIYFLQGHQQYVEAVRSTGVYQIDSVKNAYPWVKLPYLREQELMKVIGIKYEIKPPRLVCLKLAFIDPETSRLTGGSFTIKYHDMVGVIDFVILRHVYNVAMSRNWTAGNRFRCLIDESWWHGTIQQHEPLHEHYSDSMFQCYVVQWDNGEKERLSPWDLEPVDNERLPQSPSGNVPVTFAELSLMRYNYKPQDWPSQGCDVECERIIRGLERIMELSIAEPFLVPVDLNAFPSYAVVIEYPIDLSLIKERLMNRFYRRLASVQYDARHIEMNARSFNEPNSQIVKSAKVITELCLAMISDPMCYDPMPLYNQLTQRSRVKLGGGFSASSNHYQDHMSIAGADDDDEDATKAIEARRKARNNKISERLRKNSRNSSSCNDNNGKKSWIVECEKLLDVICKSPDSAPFHHPVDINEFPDYLHVVTQPIDLSVIRQNLQTSFYDDHNAFVRDVRLMFTNSRLYNTNKRSRIYVMTMRLSSMFEEQLKMTLKRMREKMKKEGGGSKMAAHLKSFSISKRNMASTSTTTTSTSRDQQLNNNNIPLSDTYNNNNKNTSGKRRRIDSDDDSHSRLNGCDVIVRPSKRTNSVQDQPGKAPKDKNKKREKTKSSNNKNIDEDDHRYDDYDDEDDDDDDEFADNDKLDDDDDDDDDDEDYDYKYKKKTQPRKGEKRKRGDDYDDDNDEEEDDDDDDNDDDDGDDDDDDGDDEDFSLSRYRKSRRKKHKKTKKHRKYKKRKKDDDGDGDDVDVGYYGKMKARRVKAGKIKKKQQQRQQPSNNINTPATTSQQHRQQQQQHERYSTRVSTGSILRRRYDRELDDDVTSDATTATTTTVSVAAAAASSGRSSNNSNFKKSGSSSDKTKHSSTAHKQQQQQSTSAKPYLRNNNNNNNLYNNRNNYNSTSYHNNNNNINNYDDDTNHSTASTTTHSHMNATAAATTGQYKRLNIILKRNGTSDYNAGTLSSKQQHLSTTTTHSQQQQSSSSSASSSHAHSASSTDNDDDDDVDYVTRVKNVPKSDRFNDEDDEEDEDDEDEDDEDEEDDEEDDGDGGSSGTETYSNRSGPSMKRSGQTFRAVRQTRRVAKKSFPEVLAKNNSNSKRKKTDSQSAAGTYRTRNQGRRTVVYAEEEDEEEDAAEKSILVAVSSRGRPHKPNVRLID